MFVRAGSILPLAPPVTSDTAWGSASASPEVLHWELWKGAATSGQNTVLEEDRNATTTASYTVSSDGLSLTFAVDTPAARTFVLEAKGVWPAVAVTPVGAASVVQSMFDGLVLTQTVRFSVSAPGQAGVKLVFGSSVMSPTLVGLVFVDNIFSCCFTVVSFADRHI